MTYRRKHDNKEDKESYTPSWLSGEGHGDDVQPRSQARTREQHVQLNRDGAMDNGKARRVRRPVSSTGDGQGSSTQGDCADERGTQASVAGGAGSQRETLVRVSFDVLRESLTDDDLNELLHNTYKPGRIIAIKQYVKKTSFAEDFYLEPTAKKIKRVKGAVPKKAIKPSERYTQNIESFQQGAEPSVETVLGFYFTLYKRHFHEEDPDWAGASTSRAITLVTKFANELTDGDYRKILNFIRKIFPLWVKRLKQGQDFPTNRPSVQSMFGGTRYFWANRNLLYKRWQEK
jgi:hypothetical protein